MPAAAADSITDARPEVGLKSPLAFSPSLRLSLFALFFLPVLLALGAWQLDRAAEQDRFAAHLDDMQARPPRPLAEVAAVGPAADLAPVRLEGRLLAEQAVWLDNRTWQGRVGYELLVPLDDPSLDRAVLVNLGWIEGTRDRSRLPVADLPTTRLAITGRLAPDRPLPAVFGPVVDRVDGAVRTQRVELDLLGDALGLALYPRVVIADPAQPGVETANFQPMRMTGARHRGYALQWFGLAAVLVIGWSFASFTRDVPSGTRNVPSGTGDAPSGAANTDDRSG